jgi:hypothetical protein
MIVTEKGKYSQFVLQAKSRMEIDEEKTRAESERGHKSGAQEKKKHSFRHRDLY